MFSVQEPAPLALTLLSADPAWILAADTAGVARIGVDLERLGKAQRQAHVPDARISNHTFEDLGRIADLVKRAKVFARLNSLHPGTKEEIEQALHLGAHILMLPWFHTADQAARFAELVAGRAEVVLLVETGAAVVRLHDIVRVPGVHEVMVGLNDLHIELGLANPMEVAASDLLRSISDCVRGAGLRFGFGGVALPGVGDLPIPADLLLARHAQLKSDAAWISRSFFRDGPQPGELPSALARLQSRMAHWRSQPSEIHGKAEAALRQAVRGLIRPNSQAR